MARDLLPIGTFASRCRLSVKALRHYDEVGLLRPVHIDVGSGYRYYHRRQAPAAIAIALLRSLDVPLPVIRTLLASEDPAALSRILEDERARQAREIRRAATALRSIERLMRSGSVFPYDVVLRDEPAHTVLVVEGTAPADLHVAVGTALVHELLARLQRLGRAPIGPIVCLFPATTDGTMILQMCTAVSDPPPGERVLTLPATTVAAARHVGPYEELGLAEHAVYAWAEAHGYEPNGALREVYGNDPARVAPEAIETEVLLPVTPPSVRTPGTAATRR